MTTRSPEQESLDLRRAIRAALRSRNPLQRIERAIGAAGWCANMDGRIKPSREGQDLETIHAVERRYLAAARAALLETSP